MSPKNEKGGVLFMGMRFDNHVSIGHIITTVALLIACVTWKNSTDNEIYNLKQANIRLEKADAELKQLIVETRSDYRGDIREVRQLLKEISDKIDRKADKEHVQ